jgi:hypothetical protein
VVLAAARVKVTAQLQQAARGLQIKVMLGVMVQAQGFQQ